MELADQFRGCLLGLAVGDALGAALGSAAVPAAGTRRPEASATKASAIKLGQPTAVTELMLCVLEAYNVRGGFDPTDICDRLVEATHSPRLAPDGMTHRALRQLADGWHFEPAAQLAYAQASPALRVNGYALPRAIPPGLLHYHDDLHLIGESRVVCGLTHQAELPKLCCTALNLALQHMLLVGTGGLLEELLIWVEPRSPELLGWLLDVPRLRPERLDTSGSACATLQAALWTALFVTDFAEGARLLTGRGGAASLLGAVGGALLGARFGVQGIPSAWREQLELRESLDRMAQRMYFISQQADLPLLLLAETDVFDRLRSKGRPAA